MQKIVLPHIVLPLEFTTLLKSNLSNSNAQTFISDTFKSNPSLEKYLENCFEEYGSSKGLTKSLSTLGWHNFRDKLAGIYVYKTLKGSFPAKIMNDFVNDIKEFESRFSDHSIQGVSRCFLLGFYLKIANLENKKKVTGISPEFKIPEEVGAFLRLSQVKSEKIDYLILILLHLLLALGDRVLLNALMSGKRIEDLLPQMPSDTKKMMFNNLLSYSASIDDPDFLLYGKI